MESHNSNCHHKKGVVKTKVIERENYPLIYMYVRGRGCFDFAHEWSKIITGSYSGPPRWCSRKDVCLVQCLLCHTKIVCMNVIIPDCAVEITPSNPRSNSHLVSHEWWLSHNDNIISLEGHGGVDRSQDNNLFTPRNYNHLLAWQVSFNLVSRVSIATVVWLGRYAYLDSLLWCLFQWPLIKEKLNFGWIT